MAWAEGRALPQSQAVNLSREVKRPEILAIPKPELIPQPVPEVVTLVEPTPLPTTRKKAARQAFGGLSGCERNVALLMAQNRSNRLLAADLFVSERTVEKHVENILSKLQFISRSQIAAWSVEIGLAKNLSSKAV